MFAIRNAAVVPTIDTAAGGIKFPIHDADGVVIARRQYRGSFRPAILRRIEFFVGVGVSTIGADAADRKDLSLNHADGQRASGCRHGLP